MKPITLKQFEAFLEENDQGDDLAKCFLHWASKNGICRQDARDAMQIVTLQVIEAIKEKRGTPQMPERGWLFTAAAREARKLDARTQRVVQYEDGWAGTNAAIPRRGEERMGTLLDAVQSVLADLPPAPREILVLHFWLDQKQVILADAVGVHPANMSRQIKRACKSAGDILMVKLLEEGYTTEELLPLQRRLIAIFGD